MSKIILTTHAKIRMIERGITLKEIKETISFPDYIISKENKIEAHRLINDKNIKIVYIQKRKFIKIVTVILK